MRTKFLIAVSATLMAASAAMAGVQPPAHTGHFKPAVGFTPAPDGTLGMALLGAQVSAAGSVNFGAGTTGGIHLNTGVYEVDFNRDVSGCYYAANSFSNAIAMFVEPRAGNVNGVFLEMIDNSNTATDSTFYLTVFCSR